MGFLIHAISYLLCSLKKPLLLVLHRDLEIANWQAAQGSSSGHLRTERTPDLMAAADSLSTTDYAITRCRQVKSGKLISVPYSTNGTTHHCSNRY